MPKKLLIDYTRLKAVAPILRTMSHPERLRIVDLLGDDEKAVGEIAEAAGTGQALTSQHLSRMKDKGVVACRSDKNKRLYRVVNRSVFKLLECITDHCEIEEAS